MISSGLTLGCGVEGPFEDGDCAGAKCEESFDTFEERFRDRTFDTEYKQDFINILFTGDLFEMPGGTAAAALGYEWRRDEIDSIPNDVARDGLLWGFFKDLGAIGEKTTKEWFAEVEMPIFGGRRFEVCDESGG